MQPIERNHNMGQVLVVPAMFLSNVYEAPNFYSDGDFCKRILRIIRDHGVFIERQRAENDPSFKQVVSYALIHNNGSVLCLRRSKREKRNNLRLRYTILVGGHVDENEISVSDKLEACVERELKEELGYICESRPIILGVVVDPRSEVGVLHLGVIYQVHTSAKSIKIQATSKDDDHVTRKGVTVCPLRPISCLCSQLRRADPWTRLVIESEVGQALFGAGSDDAQHQLAPTSSAEFNRYRQDYFDQAAG